MSAASPLSGAAAEVAALARTVEEATSGPVAERARAIRERLEGPLRIAIAGRVKAGKSTLLNALVGERLAPTDAGECTRIVSWYRRSQNYQVTARMVGGGTRPLTFRRAEGALHVELGSLDERDVAALDVEWPSSALAELTLIDTPGLASLNDDNSLRTREFLTGDGERPSEADAVIYLMRHLHRSDVASLDAFMDRSVTAASPVNAVAVLSRADEIGAGRLDALDSAARIAARYRDDPEIATLCATVVPLAGLLAETGLTLREDEVATLRTLVDTDAETLERMLLSADEFCDLHASSLTVEARRELLERLGMFGVRLAVEEMTRRGVRTAAELAPRLVEHSGLPQLREVIAEHFLPRSRVLKSRSALSALRSMARELRDTDAEFAQRVERDAERIEAGAVDLERLRAAHLVVSGTAAVPEGERGELERLLLAPDPATTLGVSPGGDAEALRAAALGLVQRWRTRAGDPSATPLLVEVYETAARTAEAIYATADRG